MHNYFNQFCNMRSRRLKAYSIVHYTYSKISLKMALYSGRNMWLNH